MIGSELAVAVVNQAWSPTLNAKYALKMGHPASGFGRPYGALAFLVQPTQDCVLG